MKTISDGLGFREARAVVQEVCRRGGGRAAAAAGQLGNLVAYLALAPASLSPTQLLVAPSASSGGLPNVKSEPAASGWTLCSSA